MNPAERRWLSLMTGTLRSTGIIAAVDQATSADLRKRGVTMMDPYPVCRAVSLASLHFCSGLEGCVALLCENPIEWGQSIRVTSDQSVKGDGG